MNIAEVRSPPWNYNYYIAIHPLQWCEIGHYLPQNVPFFSLNLKLSS